MNIDTLQHVHCIGAGGIGISGVMKFLHARGVKVSGSDAKQSLITDGLVALGISVSIGQKAKNVPVQTDLVVYTEAAAETNVERAEAKQRGILQMGHFDFLGELSKDYRTICVTGTNGKSTTTAMMGRIFEEAGLDPTVFVGSLVSGWGLGNVRLGMSDVLIVEGDEYKQKMVKLWPEVTVITNIEEDHLDVYRDLDHIIATFQELAEKTTGIVFVNRHDKNSQSLSAAAKKLFDESSVAGVELQVPGAFNQMNAAAAAVVAREYGVTDDVIRTSLESFSGIWRRFERVGEFNGATIVSDYGHHPTAVRATLEGAREVFPDRRIILLFEPHQHSRTKELFDDFVVAFGEADVVILSEIYGVAGRTEEVDVHVSSNVLLAEAMKSDAAPKEGYYTKDLQQAEAKLRELICEGDVVIIMGAGDVDVVARRLVG